MYPRNSASPPRIAIGPVMDMSTGLPATSGVSLSVIPQGGSESPGGGTVAYSSGGVVLYTPTQAETNYVAFVVIAYKSNHMPASQTIITTSSSTAGVAGLGDNAPANWINAAAIASNAITAAKIASAAIVNTKLGNDVWAAIRGASYLRGEYGIDVTGGAVAGAVNLDGHYAQAETSGGHPMWIKTTGGASLYYDGSNGVFVLADSTIPGGGSNKAYIDADGTFTPVGTYDGVLAGNITGGPAVAAFTPYPVAVESGGLTQQQVRDSLALAISDGITPAAGSFDQDLRYYAFGKYGLLVSGGTTYPGVNGEYYFDGWDGGRAKFMHYGGGYWKLTSGEEGGWMITKVTSGEGYGTVWINESDSPAALYGCQTGGIESLLVTELVATNTKQAAADGVQNNIPDGWETPIGQRMPDVLTRQPGALPTMDDLATLRTEQVEAVSPMATAIDVELVQFDDYSEANNRALYWQNASGTWANRDLTGATITFTAKDSLGAQILTKAGRIHAATGTQEVRVELAATETGLFVSLGKQYTYQLLITKGGKRETDVEGTITVHKALSTPSQ